MSAPPHPPRMDDPAALEAQLALLWLNGCVDVPAALLVTGFADLADGRVLASVVAALRARRERLTAAAGRPAAPAAGRPGRQFSSLSDAVAWLYESVDGVARETGGLPAHDVARAVHGGDRAVTVALLRVLQTATTRLDGMLAHATSDARDARHALDFSTALADVSFASNPPPPQQQQQQQQQPAARTRPPVPPPAGSSPPTAAARRASSATTAPPVIHRLRMQPRGSSDESGMSTESTLGSAAGGDAAVDTVEQDGPSVMDITSLVHLPSSAASHEEPQPPARLQRPSRPATTPVRAPSTGAAGTPASAQPLPPPRSTAAGASASDHRRGSTCALSVAGSHVVTRSLAGGHPRPLPPQQPWNVSTALDPAAHKRAASLVYGRKTESVVVAHRVVAAPADTALTPPSPAAVASTAAAAAAAALSASRVSSPATPSSGSRRQPPPPPPPPPQQQQRTDAAPPPAAAAAGLIVGGIYDPAYRPRVLVTQPPQLAAAAALPISAGTLDHATPALGAPQRHTAYDPETRNAQKLSSVVATQMEGEQEQEEGVVAPEDHAAGAAAPPPSEGLTAHQRAALAWVRHLGVELDASKRAAMGLGGGGEASQAAPGEAQPPHSHLGGGGSQVGGPHPGAGAAVLLPRLMEDGVFLCELLAAAEVRAGSKLPTVAVEVGGRAGGGTATSRGGAGGSATVPAAGVVVRVLPGTTVPRPGFSLSAAASSRNIDAALSLLRERPRVSPRHLYSPHELLHARHSPALAWGLLEDIYRGYRALTDAGGLRSGSSPVSGSPSPGAHARIALGQQPSSPAATGAGGALATPPVVTERPRVAASPSAAGGGERCVAAGPPGAATPLPAPVPRDIGTHAAPSAASTAPPPHGPSHAGRRLRPLAHEVVPPAGTGALHSVLPAALASASRKRDVLAAADGLRAEVRAFLGPLGLAARLDASQLSAPALAQSIFNGALLAELAAVLEPDTPPLGPSCPSEMRLRHYAAPRTVPEARANTEAALAVFRRSPTAQCVLPRTSPLRYTPGEAAAAEAARIPPPCLWATEALLRGDDAAAWALLWYLARAYSFCAGRGLYIMPDAAAPDGAEAGDVGVSGSGGGVLPAAAASAAPSAGPPSRRASTIGDVVAAHGALLTTHESAVISWLRALGVLLTSGDTAPGAGGGPAAGFESLGRSLVDGTLLAAVAARLSGLPRLPGTTSHHAASDVAARGNLRRAVEVLRRLPGFPQRVAAAPGLVHALRTGSRLETLALLQDAASWQQAQQQQQQQQQQQRPVEPMFVVAAVAADAQLVRPTPQPPPVAAVHGSRVPSPSPAATPAGSDASGAARVHPSSSTAGTTNLPVAAHQPAVTTLAGGGALAAELRALMARFQGGAAADAAQQSDAPGPAPSAQHVEQLDADTGATRHVPAAAVDRRLSSRAGSAQPSPPRRASLSSSTDEVAARRASVVSPGAELEEFLAAAASGAVVLGAHAPSQGTLLPPVHPPPSTALHASVAAEAHALGAWLAGLGLGDAAALAAQLGPDSDIAPAFQDGTLLAAVVQLCEDRAGLRRSCVGLDRAPKSGAARLANVRRVLEVLREHRAMPLTHLWSELALTEGDPRVTRQLLAQVRRAYGQHLHLR